MELESVLARISQLEKDLAECRAKVFFLEAVNEIKKGLENTVPSRIEFPRVEPIQHSDPITDLDFGPAGGASEPNPSPPRKLSPWTVRLRPKTYDEEATEMALNPDGESNKFLQRLNEEMFDGNS